jgi:hypothetical protein
VGGGEGAAEFVTIISGEDDGDDSVIAQAIDRMISATKIGIFYRNVRKSIKKL